jgi:hypothetical protein
MNKNYLPSATDSSKTIRIFFGQLKNLDKNMRSSYQ